MKNNFKRCLALLLALMTIVGAFSIPVSAAEACDHDWEVYGEIVKPTCTAQGYTTEFCPKCQEYRITDVKGKLPHEHIPATKEALPTCSKWGYFVGALVCPLCGDIDDTNWTQEQKDKYKPVDTLPTTEAELKKDKYHKWGDPTFEGEACVGDTYKVKYTCSECKETIVFDKTGSGAHDYEYTNRVNPTCLTEGSVVRTCKECGEKTTLKIEKSAHTFDGKNVKYDFVKVGNDAKAQHQSYENCVVCGAKGNQGAKSDHDWDESKTVTVPS
ncbi:MAG: hypothetical protein IJV70_02970, partial [Clostridia bacterium]|nr:hypothetical protein [Clostridia bacterium]